MSNRLDGHVALVTGGAGGIGKAFALRLAAEGAAVAVVDMADAAGTVGEIAAAGGKSASFAVDITDRDQVTALAGEVEQSLGTVDILVNNVGIYPQAMFEDITQELWDRVFAVNVGGMFITCQTFLPGMKEKGWGRVVNVTSNSVRMQVPAMVHYLSSKMAVIGLTRGIATEYGEHGITANAIAPSGVRTPGTSGIPEEGFQMIAQLQTIKRTSVPEDLTGTLAYLVSDDAAFVTGQTLFVDGGMARS